MEIVYTNGMITINETMVVVVVSFLLFVFIMNRLMFRPLTATMDARRQRIAGLEKAVDEMRAEAEQLTRELQKREEAVKKEARDMRKELETAGNRKANELVQASRAEVTRIRNTAQAEVNQQIEEAREQIQKETELLAKTITETILGRETATG